MKHSDKSISNNFFFKKLSTTFPHKKNLQLKTKNFLNSFIIRNYKFQKFTVEFELHFLTSYPQPAHISDYNRINKRKNPAAKLYF